VDSTEDPPPLVDYTGDPPPSVDYTEDPPPLDDSHVMEPPRYLGPNGTTDSAEDLPPLAGSDGEWPLVESSGGGVAFSRLAGGWTATLGL
jgi:hypothetical protein